METMNKKQMTVLCKLASKTKTGKLKCIHFNGTNAYVINEYYILCVPFETDESFFLSPSFARSMDTKELFTGKYKSIPEKYIQLVNGYPKTESFDKLISNAYHDTGDKGSAFDPKLLSLACDVAVAFDTHVEFLPVKNSLGPSCLIDSEGVRFAVMPVKPLQESRLNSKHIKVEFSRGHARNNPEEKVFYMRTRFNGIEFYTEYAYTFLEDVCTADELIKSARNYLVKKVMDRARELSIDTNIIDVLPFAC